MARDNTHGFDYSISYAKREVINVSLSGVPHASCEDDVYREYFIPKGLFRSSWPFCCPSIACLLVWARQEPS
jgi:hypothetical protein